MTEALHDHPEVAELAAVRTADTVAKKVAWPAVALVGLGVAGLVAGALLKSEVVVAAGVALLGASGVTGGLGWYAPPPVVEHAAILPDGRVDRFDNDEPA